MKKSVLCILLIAVLSVLSVRSQACTGITLQSGDSAWVLARTIEWGGSNLNSRYVIVPRGHKVQSLTPNGADGLIFVAKYGYVGFAVEQDELIAEGLNEKGLSAGLFYFPGYGEYEPYNEADRLRSLSDFQLVPYILGACATVDEVKEAVKKVKVVGIDPRASTVHWRFADPSGRQIVLEIIDGKPVFYENRLGVLTNSPDFNWQMTNLNNYVALRTGSVPPQTFGSQQLTAFGMGSGLMGLPGDITPPSRFVRAAFFQTTAPVRPTAEETVVQSFLILNNFDIPIGLEYEQGTTPADIPSATQWTSATDLTNRVIYYRTMYNTTIRSIDLKNINFKKVKYQVVPLDMVRRQPIVPVAVK